MMILFIAGCGSEDFTVLGFNEKESELLSEVTSVDELENHCPYVKSLQALLYEEITEEEVMLYCQVKYPKGKKQVVKELQKAELSQEEMIALLRLPYYRNDNTKRYLEEMKHHSIKEAVKRVNMNLDIPYYSEIKEIEDVDDPLMLVNKYSKLPADYAPNDLVPTPSVCVIGEDYSCFPSAQYVRSEVATQFEKFVEAAKKEGFTLKSIGSLRDYQYQEVLYQYYKNTNGQAYADAYVARPGQSEHNTALAIDVTFDTVHYDEIERSPHYEWFLQHMADYGFILRYPKGKEDITGFDHESWHLRYVGKKHAKKIMQKGITLEEYLAVMDAER